MRGLTLTLLTFGCLLTGCQNQPVTWRQASWSKMGLQEADAQCQYQANAAAPAQGGGWLYQVAAYNNLYRQCMNAQGWSAQ